MDKIGFAISGLLAVVAVGAGYAIYRSRGSIKNIATSAVGQHITNPITGFFSNLESSTTASLQQSNRMLQKQQDIISEGNLKMKTEQLQYEASRAIAQSNLKKAHAGIGKTYQDTLDEFEMENKKLPADTIAADIPDAGHRKANPLAPKNEPLFAPSPSGWYYRNFAPGGRADTQIKLDQGSADKLRKRGQELHFLTGSQKLSQRSFNTYGKSKGFI